MFQELTIWITFFGLAIASYFDIRVREIPDYLNYFLICFALITRILWSIFEANLSLILWIPSSFVILFGLSYLMYLIGQMGGGDAKLMIACSILLSYFPGDSLLLEELKFPFFLDFFANLLFCGAIYGVGTIYLIGLRNRAKLRGKLSQVEFLLIPLSCLIAFLLWGVIPGIGFMLGLVLVCIASMRFLKVTEDVCFYIYKKPTQLVEGDWLVKEIKVEKRVVVPKRGVGLTLEDIERIKDLYKKGKVREILIKEGLPFVPAFLLAFLVTLLYRNLIVLFISSSTLLFFSPSPLS
jgi:prepilin signal peptidase PulO-like enzyme (type II secretory pathway)